METSAAVTVDGIPHPNPSTDAPPTRVGRARTPARRWRRWGLFGLGIAAVVLGAACDATVEDEILTVKGLAGPEHITLRLAPDDPGTLELHWNDDGHPEYAFARSTFSRIEIDGAGGDDTVVVDDRNGVFTDTEVTTLIGGDGNDTLVGGFGNEWLEGGPGDDTLDGGGGIDLLRGRAGNDELRWGAGDASDTASGGDGVDRLVYVGTDEPEVIDLVASSGRALIARDLDLSVVDVVGVETVEIETRGGSDTVRQGDVSSTTVDAVEVGLSATGGGDDGQIDVVLPPAGATLSPVGTSTFVAGDVPTTVSGGFGADRLHVVGTPAPDALTVRGGEGADAVAVTASGTDVFVTGATTGVHLLLTSVELLDVDLGAGADSFTSTGNVAALLQLDVDGGPGADTLSGGNGADVLHGGEGPDHIDGQQGVDSVAGDGGDDVVQWDPGDGSESIVGGPGTDRMVFNGANIGEVFGIGAVGDHVRFTRNVATIALDLDEVELFDLRALGGADILQPASLAGTDLTTVTVDFAAFGGGDDAQADEVVVPQGHVISQDGAAATVAGFGAQIRAIGGSVNDRLHVTGSDPLDVVPIVGTSGPDTVNVVANGTDVSVFGATAAMQVLLTSVDRLDVDLLAGTDTFTSTGNVAPLVALDVDGGSGTDTLLGGNGADLLDGGGDADFIDGQQGNDVAVGGSGDDVLQWDPGDGSDTIDGGAGTDRLQFNGSSIAEQLTITRAEDHVRLTRNVAVILMDLVGIERIDLNPLGGADIVQVDDVTGTHLRAVNVNLALFASASPDAAADQIVVNGTAGDDAVSVTADSSAVVVDGLTAVVRVIGADPTLDRLTVNGLEGADGITSSEDAAALILLDLFP